MVFRSDRAFHPERLWQLISEDFDGGAFGTDPAVQGLLPTVHTPRRDRAPRSEAGSVAHFEPAGGARRSDRGENAQELVFIGTDLRPDVLHDALTACLLAEDEVLPHTDPFPPWDTPEDDETCEHEHHDVPMSV